MEVDVLASIQVKKVELKYSSNILGLHGNMTSFKEKFAKNDVDIFTSEM